jgi:hypothetical protein
VKALVPFCKLKGIIMAKAKPIEKQPFEAFPVYGKFTKVLEEGETIDIINSEVIVSDKDGNVDASMVDEPTKNVQEDKLVIRIQNGSPENSPYNVSFRITTSLGNKWEVDAQLNVIEKKAGG